MRRTVLCALLATGAGCGAGNQTYATGSATVSGTLAGVTMCPGDAISTQLQVASGTVSGTVGSIVISNSANNCARISSHQATKNSQWLSLAVGVKVGSTVVPPSAPGTFQVYSSSDVAGVQGPFAQVLYSTTDEICQSSGRFDGVTGGKIEITGIDAKG